MNIVAKQGGKKNNTNLILEKTAQRAACTDPVVISYFPIRTWLVLFKDTKSCHNKRNKRRPEDLREHWFLFKSWGFTDWTSFLVSSSSLKVGALITKPNGFLGRICQSHKKRRQREPNPSIWRIPNERNLRDPNQMGGRNQLMCLGTRTTPQEMSVQTETKTHLLVQMLN